LKILIITQYFPPEVGAPQNRLFELSVRLREKNIEIDVLTAMPNYPQMEIFEQYKGKFYIKEILDGLNIHRCWLYTKKTKSILIRLINYFSFVFSALLFGLLKLDKKYDYIICESPPLFLGITAYLLKKVKRARLIFNVSDLWPESAKRLGLVTNKFFLMLATLLEAFLYKNSEVISAQTQGIIKNISSRFPNKKLYWFKNGVNLNLFNSKNVSSNFRKENNFSNDDFIVFYGGIIGYAQGLELILHAARLLNSYEKIKFVIMGDGPVRDDLISLKEELLLENVFFFHSRPKTEMPSIIKSIDISLIPLKRLDLFKGAIPSKIFESLSMRKPILLGVEGEAKDLFINNGHSGLAFTPEDFNDLSQRILQLYNSPNLVEGLGIQGYNYVRENFNQDKIADDFWELLKYKI